MENGETNVRFVLIFGVVWLCFGVFGLIDSPERVLVTLSQFVAAVVHFVYALVVWKRSIAKKSKEQD